MRFILLIATLCIGLYAHKLQENYLKVDYNKTTKRLNIAFEIETRPFENQTIDDNKNGIISFKELKKHQKKLFDIIQKNIVFTTHSKILSLKKADITFHRYKTQTYMLVKKTFFDTPQQNLKLNYSLFFDKEKQHKLLIELNSKKNIILDTNHRQYIFNDDTMTQYQRVKLFIKEGIFHILDGSDHLLFVLMLLIPSIIKYTKFKNIFVSLLKIITTFSIAHSTTLFIAGMGWYIPNTTLIESCIALSIFVVALFNFFKKYNHISYIIVFAFGLIHGFGFANVLEIANMQTPLSFVVALFGFNLGVEFGQIGVILTSLPLLLLIAKTPYKDIIFRYISFIALIISFVWFLQRVGLL